MIKKIFLLLAVLVLTSLACSVTVPRGVEVGEKEILKVSESASADKAENYVNIKMGAGKLNLGAGAEKLVEGQITYNVASLKPSVKSGDHSVSITQSGELKGLPGDDVVNQWDLKLGKSPTDLSINAGAYEGKIELGGVPLTRFSVRDGASKVRVNFDQPNPEKMSRFEYYTGASNVELSGLSNANFDELIFEGGAGSFKLDFSGKLQRDGYVNVVGGVNNIEITIPKGTPAVITLSGSLSNDNTEGTWTIHNKVYETEGTGPKLTIDIENGVGNLILRQK
jgi:hypothetical protein